MDAKVTAAEPFVREPAAGPTLNVLGVIHVYKATGVETAGSFSLKMVPLSGSKSPVLMKR